MNPHPASIRVSPCQAGRASALLCTLAAAALLPALVPLPVLAQAPTVANGAATPATRTQPAAKPAAAVHPRRKPHLNSGKSAAQASAAMPVQTPAAPIAPPPPNWPANNAPSPATITLDSRGLRIEAVNASLQQILKQVSDDTGAKIEGGATDRRIFGVYGPGVPRDVMAQLLQGMGFNVLMFGDDGHGSPREIVLSARTAGGSAPEAYRPQPAQPEPADDDPQPDDNASSDDQPQHPPQSGMPGDPRSRQLQDDQQRQQQIQQQRPQL